MVKKKSKLKKIFSKKDKVEITAYIRDMKCKQAKDDKSILICDIVAKNGDEEIKEKIAIETPRLKFIKVEEKGKKPEYYFKEVEVDS